ncbi:P-loop containing nucleoside triphosphate hydrolase protein [Mollisia scopiformis]|uniref:p-loop containing nucleoside triphosphate hydrolase protein n=1 Tax=Mollisia scopiformis TaxID=149040 RepID=A0A132BD63_MOLSC|nr:P-loop containing nucleoside triphosphate hydrolase protein [Mollisia scopiformis]KUJ10193.1 P-loop containing nucleoside triphosphate hydrolase protein [Mollisia scopiformis]
MEETKEKPSASVLQPKQKRIIRVDQIFSKKTRQIHFVPTKKPEKTEHKFNKTVLVIRRIISSKGLVAAIEVDIKSPALKEVLDEIFEGVEGLRLNKTPPIAEPELLFHAGEQLYSRLKKLEASPNPNEALINDISAVLDFIQEHFGGNIDSLKSLSEHGEITYNLIWALFPPKTLGYTAANIQHQPQVFIFKEGTDIETSTEKYYYVTGQVINHDGMDFGRGEMHIKIPYFEGTKKVRSLAAYPFSQHARRDELRKELIERGRKFARLVTSVCQEYAGMGVKEERTPQGMEEMLFEATGRVMIDPGAFRLYQPNWSNLLNPWVHADMPKDNLSDEEYLICNHRVLGFSLASKEWGAFAVSPLKDVVWDESAFEKLIIEPKRRDLICSLVRSHRNDKTGFDDIIRNKGKGLIGLLSGGPGVGKTLTAEVVAELTHKPLYMISAGELGTELEKVDQRLQMVLDITRRWSCVLLIDEADVFLQERSNLDMLRNALVSIFLRRLEYFQGILIMTTNRRKAIDPAFQSRIHFKIHYPALTESSRAQVWKDFLSTAPAGVKKPELSNEQIVQLARIPLNGREIKNTISCAFSMSRESGMALTVQRVEEVLSILVDDWNLDE